MAAVPNLFETEVEVIVNANDPVDVGVVSLTDRRKIKDLEAQLDDMQAKLYAALGRAQPGLTTAGYECGHHGTFTVSDQLMEIRCKLCNALVDPYVALRKIAHREVNFCYSLNTLRDEKKLLENETKALKARRARLRAQVSKATPDMPLAKVGEIMRSVNADTFGVQRVGTSYFASMKLRDSKRVMRSELQSTVEVAVDQLIGIARIMSDTPEEIAE